MRGHFSGGSSLAPNKNSSTNTIMHYDLDTLTDYLAGELSPAEDGRIYAHLATCPECTAAYEREAALRDLVRVTMRSAEAELPAMVKARVWEAIRDAQPTFLDRVRAVWRPVVVAPIAAAIAIVAYVGMPVLRPNAVPPSGVDANYYLEEHAAQSSQNPLSDHGIVIPAAMTGDRTGSTTAPLIDAVDAASPDAIGDHE